MKKDQLTAIARVRSRMATPLGCAAIVFACSAKTEVEPADTPAPAGSSEAEANGAPDEPRPTTTPPTTTPPATTPPEPTWPGKSAPTTETAHALFERVIALYEGHASSAYPAGSHQLSIQLLEGKDPHAGSTAYNWTVSVSAGLIERKQMTVDILAAFVCHEVGHIVGGFPFKRDQNSQNHGTGAASEGQADYFAAKDCLTRLWAEDHADNAAAASLLNEPERARCATAYADEASQALCGRILLTSLGTAHIFKEEMAEKDTPYPSFDTPDRSEVSESKKGYATSQCRLDTFVAGALCSVKAVGTSVPGFVPPYDEFSEAYEEAARPSACQEGPGARPHCWFAPNRRAFDCSSISPSCTINEFGLAEGKGCDPGTGPTYTQCEPGIACEINDRGKPECAVPLEPILPEEEEQSP